MFKNYIKIAWRNIKSNSLFSIINVIGLSLSIAVAILLYLFIVQERSFDTMYPKKDRIYRVLLHPTDTDKNEVWPQVPPITGPTIINEVPGVEYSTRLLSHNFGENANINIDNTNYIEKAFYWADDHIFNIFDIEILRGLKNPIEDLNTVALSESTAKRYFGNEDPIGKSILIDNRTNLEVTAIYKDFPLNSTLDCNALASFKSSGFQNYKSWDNASFETYFLAPKQVSENQLNKQLNEMLSKYVSKSDSWFYFSGQPLSRIHLYSTGFDESYSSRIGDINEIRSISFLALLILIIACANYINLSTARSQKRSKDVGINKTLGASSHTLRIRFYIETAIITFISLSISILLAVLVLPLFNSLMQQELQLSVMKTPEFVLGLGLIFFITTLFAGLYPSIYLSSFAPKSIFSPSYKGSKNIILIRKGLIIFQFAITIILIISVLVISGQVEFMKNKELGFNPESVMAISIDGIKDKSAINVLANKYKGLSIVKAVSKVQGYPGMTVSGRTLRKNDNDQGINIQSNFVDSAVAKVLQLKLLSGRMPSLNNEGDSLVEVVLNKKAIDYLGYTSENAIGKKVIANLGDNAFIVGVVDNFNYASLKSPVGAYAFNNGRYELPSYLLVRFNVQSISNVVDKFKIIFEQSVPNVAFSYTFLDDHIKQLYNKEQKTADIGFIFSVLAILIACMGLFGLAAYMAEQRTKEIGIRKVLGASITNVTSMLSKDFLVLVFIAMLIAFPIAYYSMDIWLQGFAYRIKLHWHFFILSGLITIIIALLTTSTQAIKAARSNPIESLRIE